METIKIGMLGIGTVAKGTYRTLELNRSKIERMTGVSVEISKILNRHPDRDRGIQIPREKYVTDAREIFDDPEIQIVVQLIGGIDAATDYMAQALRAGKHVVTANKAAIMANGKMLQELAQENHVLLRFEASVAGGIPILTSIKDPLAANEFSSILGILNGTTNYILTQMAEHGTDYADALRDAQEKGFAEADPTADVEGIDVGNKLSILISMIFGYGLPQNQIPTKGITDITSTDITFAEEFGYRIKLLASAERKYGELEASVQPTLVPEDHAMANINNEFNAVFLSGNAVDDLMFYGKGAGSMPTGSAVAGDILNIAKEIAKGSAYDIMPPLRYDSELAFIGEGKSKYYIRVAAVDKPGIIGNIGTVFGKHGVGIQTMLQRSGNNSYSETVPLILIVYETERADLQNALKEIEENHYVKSVDNVLRVLK